MVLLHGLFGMGNNLGAIARSLAPDFTVYSVDLPNHGRSDWVPFMGLADMASHLEQWLESQGLERVDFVGHSLGGKLAMELALLSPGSVNALVVADIAPVPYEPHHDSVFAALDAVAQSECVTRREAMAIMEGYLEEPGVAEFLLLSLTRDEQGLYRWRFNLEGLKAGYGSVREAPDGGMRYEGPVLFVKGEESDYILPEHREAITGLFPRAELKIIPGAGHWLHAQQPRLFNSIVGRFLKKQHQP